VQRTHTTTTSLSLVSYVRELCVVVLANLNSGGGTE
jgi:hypothetical protein